MEKPLRNSEMLASSLVNSVNQAVGKLLDLWNAMGINKERQLERMQTAKSHIETLLNDMIEEENCLKEKIENDIEIQKDQLNVTRYQLGLDPYKLQKKKESLTATKDILMKKVQLLWDRLQWPQENQERFTKMTSQCSICEAMNMWEEELQTLEEVQKEKVKERILKVRQDLESYWQKCFYTDEQKAAFQPFYDDSFSEELLKPHNEEVFKIKMIYEEAKCLYDSVHKWEAILNHFIELEKKSTDPSRLLNRGGNLLKDERERSKTQKQLSKLGEELKKKIENWEEEHNSVFLIRSQRFLDTMAHQLQHYKLKKDQPKTSMKWEESATSKGAMKRSAHLNIPTTNKIRKVDSIRNIFKASSCNNIATNFAVPSKQSFPSKKELAVKSSINNRILNSTLKENLDG